MEKLVESANGPYLQRLTKGVSTLAVRPRGPWGSYKGVIILSSVKSDEYGTHIVGYNPTTGQTVDRTWPRKCTFRVFDV
jgi:hypothetical protein